MELGAERAGAPGGGLASVVVAASYVELGFWGVGVATTGIHR
jgi:hypothetical protein